MQVDDRVAIKTVHFRGSDQYRSQVVKFGSSDGVSLIAIHWAIEGMGSGGAEFMGCALSRNPEHELAPPDEIAEWVTDESLYGRGQWYTVQATAAGFENFPGIQVVPMHDIVVPNRQICVNINISYGSFGIVGEIYFKEVKLTRQEADLMNITWGKYRR